MPHPSKQVLEVNYWAVVLTASLTAILLYFQSCEKRESSEEELLSPRKRHSKSSSSGATLTNTDAHTISTATAYEKCIGQTPMIVLQRLSALVGREIRVKMESMNPGGTGKDRAALGMIQEAERTGQLPSPSDSAPRLRRNKDSFQQNALQLLSLSNHPLDQILHQALERSQTGGIVVEGTSGSTGISLATLALSRGHSCIVVLPDDQAREKQIILQTLGALVHIVPTASISNPQHYVNVAQQISRRGTNLFGLQVCFVNQFENEANFETHYTKTGPEILRQCPNLSAFVMSSGTGGTIAGVSTFLKDEQKRQRGLLPWTRLWETISYWGGLSKNAALLSSESDIKCVLVDPPGSSLYHKIEHGVAFAPEQREQQLKRHRYDTIAEGIGLDRVTQNLTLGLDAIDAALMVSDQEAVDMAHWLLRHEGLWVGSSSAMNLVGAVRTARSLPPGSTVVTIVCDHGQRHVTRFWNPAFVRDERGLEWPSLEEGGDRYPDCLNDIFASSNSMY